MDLITRKLTLDQVQLPDWAKKVAEDSESKTVVRKGLTPSDMTFSEGERAAVFRINSARLDRDSEICVPKGIDLSAFNKTGKPVMWSHIYNQDLPLGKCAWIKADSSGFLVAKIIFAQHPKANDVYNFLRDGFKLSTSIGFIAKTVVFPDSYDELDIKSLGINPKDLKQARCVYTSSELIELSICAIPSNIDAELISVNKGLTNRKELEDLGYVYEIMEESNHGEQKTHSEETTQTKEANSGTDSSAEEKEVDEFVIEINDKSDEIIEEIKSEDEFCNCEESEYDNDTCKACGGKRKPKKEVLELGIDLTYEEINDLDKSCMDGIAKTYEFDVDVNKKYLFEDCMFKNLKQLTEEEVKTKNFDIAAQPSIPSNKILDIYCKFLGCKVKNIYKSDFTIPWTLAGSYLAGFKAICANFEYNDTRSYNSIGTEYSPTYEVIKINSKIEDDFLVEGADFYHVNGKPVILSFYKGWEGIFTSIYTSRTNKDINKATISSVHKWVEEKNPLKGEKFSLSKEFFDIDDKDSWDTLITDNLIEKSMKSAEKLIKNKEFNGRGILMLGPPGCLDKNTQVYYRRGKRNSGRWISLEDLYKKFNGINNREWDLSQDTYLQSYDGNGKVIWNKMLAVFDSGYKECVRLETKEGHFIIGTPDHPIMDSEGNFKELQDFNPGDLVLRRGSMKPQKGNGKEIKNRPKRKILNVKYHPVLAKHRTLESGIEYFYNRIPYARCVVEANMNGIDVNEYIEILKTDQQKSSMLKVLPRDFDVHHIDENTLNDSIDNLIAISHEEHARIHRKNCNFDPEYVIMSEVLGVERYRVCHTYDVQMEDPHNNFVTDGLFFVHNTGKTKSSRILMTQCQDQTFIWVSSKDLTKTWYPEEKIALGFKLARSLAPSILLLEDIDNWINGKITDMMKTELDGLKKNKNVIIILTTNSPERLPNTLIDRPGRFHDVLNFDHPTKDVRARMFKEWCNIESDELLSKTEGFSGAYMWELIEFAKSIAEDEGVTIEEALTLSLDKINSQKELISNIKKETKSISEVIKENVGPVEIKQSEPILEIETEPEITIDLSELSTMIKSTVQNAIPQVTVDDLLYESIQKAKGKMFY